MDHPRNVNKVNLYNKHVVPSVFGNLW